MFNRNPQGPGPRSLNQPLFLSTTYLHPIPHIPAKPRFSPVRWDKDAQLLPLQ
jgi:hypothetical protein